MGSEWPRDGDRVRLRALHRSDAARIAEIRGDSEVARFQSWETCSLLDAEALIEKVRDLVPDQPGQWFQFGIELHETGELIGDCALHCPLSDPSAAEIGFTLGRSYWSRGYAREAVALLIDWLFAERDKTRVFAVTDGRNGAAHLLLQNLGFGRDADFDRMVCFKGEFGPECVWSRRP
jgi:RimJ/RimL family protein N-acetyltransferase